MKNIEIKLVLCNFLVPNTCNGGNASHSTWKFAWCASDASDSVQVYEILRVEHPEGSFGRGINPLVCRASLLQHGEICCGFVLMESAFGSAWKRAPCLPGKLVRQCRTKTHFGLSSRKFPLPVASIAVQTAVDIHQETACCWCASSAASNDIRVH